MDTAASTGDDNPFAGPKAQPADKVSVVMPTDEWLCKKMAKLNITLVEGYPSHSSEAGGLLKEQFVHPTKSQSKWYGLFSDHQKTGSGTRDTVSSWSTDASKLNSSYSRITRAAGIASTPPPSRQITQDNLRRWEKSAHEASAYCNQAAGFSRCLFKVQENMQCQLKAISTDLSKGKSSAKVSTAVDELQYLTDFNASISQAMAKTKERLSDFVFVTVANTTLTRRDAYLSHLKSGIKPRQLCIRPHYRWPHSSLMKLSSKLNRILPHLRVKASHFQARKVTFTYTNRKRNVLITGNQTAQLGRT